MQNVSYNLGIATAARVITGAIGLVVVGILTRTLGPEGFGQYNTIFAYLFIFSAIADMGLYTILVREVSKVDRKAESSVVSKIFTLRLVFVATILVLADLVVFLFPYPPAVKLGVFVASLFSIFSSLSQILTGIFQKYLKTYFVSISDVVARLFQLALILFLIKIKTGLLAFVWVVVLSEIVHFLLIYKFADAIVRVRLVVDKKYWREIMKIALPVAASLVFTLIYFKLDTIILSVIKPARDVGIYSVAYKVLEVVIFLPAIYIGLIMPRLSKWAVYPVRSRPAKGTATTAVGRSASNGASPEFTKTFRRAFDVLSIFVFHFCLYLFLMSEHVVRIIGGGGFGESGAVLKILSLAVFLIFFGNLGGNAIVALNLQRKGMWIYMSGAVVNVAANIILIPRYTYFAAAWTTVATELLITLLMFYLIKKYASTMPTSRVFARSFWAAFFTSIIMLPFLGSFVSGTAVSLFYYVILFALGGFTTSDIRAVLSFRKSQTV